MAYVPGNLTVFTVAAAAAQMAITTSDRYTTDATAADYAGPSAVALTIAESFDGQWTAAGIGAPDTYHVMAIVSALTDAWQSRTPNSVQTSFYDRQNASLVAIIQEGHAAFVASGSAPNAWPSGAGGGGTPLDRCKYIASGSAVAGPNGFIGTPYATIAAAIAAVGIGTSVADNTQNMVYMLEPAKGAIAFGFATYPESVTGTPYRNEELAADSEFVVINGQYNLANTAAAVTAAGGNPANKPAGNIRTFRNVIFLQNATITDDGSLTTEIICTGNNPSLSGFQGSFDTSACSAISVVTALNWTFLNGYAGVSSSSGALFSCLICAIGGSVTCKSLQWELVNYTGTSITVASGTNSNMNTVNFGGSNPVITGAGGLANVTMDLPSWNSFLAAGGTLVNISVTVTGISRTMQNAPFLAAAGVAVTLVADAASDNSANNQGNLVLCDQTGAACVVNAPNPAQVGDLFGAGNQGVGNTPSQINATGGTTIEDPGNPGVYSAANGQVNVKGPGQVTWWKLISGNKWKIIASA